MPSPSRADLEKAAQRHFARLSVDLDRPRAFDEAAGEIGLEENLELSRARVEALEDQLRRNTFDERVRQAAMQLATRVGLEILSFEEQKAVVAAQLAARAERELHRRFLHQLATSAEPFSGDLLFSEPLPPPSRSAEPIRAASGSRSAAALSDLSELYLNRKRLSGVGSSQITELTRMLHWLQQELGADRPIDAITKEDLRSFRDGIERLDVTLRGREAPFRDRQTNQRENQIKSATSTRYWKSAQAFFDWALNEGHLEQNPAVGLKIETRKDDLKRTPPPFSPDEIKRLLQTPLYSGYRGPRRVATPGDLHHRFGHWWSGILALFTGLRAGELGQLLPSDFRFDAEVPHVSVTTLDDEGKPTKRTKNKASIRDIPLAPELLELGLREFVEDRARRHKGRRVFLEFRLGSNGRSSEGLTAFWGNYLRKFGLWAEGRSTHMFRHTTADRLRANGASDENIGAILGHSGRSITAHYGSGQPLRRKAFTLEALNFGFDLVAAVGGPYDPATHGCGPRIKGDQDRHPATDRPSDDDGSEQVV